MDTPVHRDPDARGYFGPFGGRYVPETLVEPIEELERAYFAFRDDVSFRDELARLLTHYVGRETPLYEAPRLSAASGGVRVFLKREDLTHTGAHKINNALGQALLAKRMGNGSASSRREGSRYGGGGGGATQRHGPSPRSAKAARPITPTLRVSPCFCAA